MLIRHILPVFCLFLMFSCQSPEAEIKEVLHDTTLEITDSFTTIADSLRTALKTEGSPEAPDSNFINKKKNNGIDFFASGTEPFWSLDMDMVKDFSFRTADNFVLNAPATSAMPSKNKNITRYRAQVESGEIIITIQKKECINAMSGAKSPYEVHIKVKHGIDKDFRDFAGCGQYTSASAKQ